MVLESSPMIFRFGACELDEARRSLRVDGAEVELQPRVFDLLVYLVRNRDRVVSKQELLDQVWPGTVVVDNALQRVVSIARSTLAEGGAREALRTYPRHGYRFCADAVTEVSHTSAPRRDSAAEGAYRAIKARAWNAAIDAFEAADRRGEADPADLEGWGRVSIWAGRAADGISPLKRAVPAHLAAGNRRAAARATLLLAMIHIEQMEVAIAGGLVKRAAALLESEELSCENGHLAWGASRLALLQGNFDDALRHAEEALDIGRKLHDADIESLGLMYQGHALMGLGRFADGVALHDEAAAAVIAGGVSPWAGGLVYCGVLSATRSRCDWQRAGQWTDEFTRWCAGSGMPAFPGTCRLHRAEVLCVRGNLVEAEREVSEVGAQLSRIAPWAEGDAYRVLGDILLLRGDLDAAEAAFRQAHALGWEPQPGLARLQIARDKPDAAVRGLERALEDCNWVMRERRGLLLATLVHVALAAGQPQRARRALEQLEEDPPLWSTPALTATVDQARAEIALRDARTNEAIALLRRALRQWHEIGAPLSAADTRARLAELLFAEGDQEAAELELAAAESIAEKCGTGALCKRCAELRRKLTT